MDWLAKNHAVIDCRAREVIFRPLTEQSFKFKGADSQSTLTIISTLKTLKLIDYGAWVLLASVLDTSQDASSVTHMPMVQEFEDVFPQELL